jgi:hypothetical protein
MLPGVSILTIELALEGSTKEALLIVASARPQIKAILHCESLRLDTLIHDLYCTTLMRHRACPCSIPLHAHARSLSLCLDRA